MTADKRSGIANDLNRADDEKRSSSNAYIVRLIGQVIAVSLETVEIVAGFPEWEILETGKIIEPEGLRRG